MCSYKLLSLLDKDFMTDLDRLEMLQSFSLLVDSESIKEHNGLKELLDSLSRIPSLELCIYGPYKPSPISSNAWSVIGRLTNLVALEMDSFLPEEPISLDALSSIDTLMLRSKYLVNKDGTPLFPSLPRLTFLGITDICCDYLTSKMHFLR